MRPTEIQYDYPAGGLDPFDLTEPRTQHLHFAGRWARAWVAADGIGEQPVHVAEAIPMGYKALSTVEKLAVVQAGVLVRRWPATDSADDQFRRAAGYYRGQSEWTRPYWAITQTEPQLLGFATLDAAIAHAVAHPGSNWLVGRPLAHESWH